MGSLDDIYWVNAGSAEFGVVSAWHRS
jgi:hypothetical protein